jgi:hypothetical protein
MCLVKDTHQFRIEFCEIDGQKRAAGMQDQIEALGQQIDVAAQCFSHAPFDAGALVGLAYNLADGESDARSIRQQLAAISGNRLWGQKPAHGRRLPLARSRVSALVVRMFA